MLIIRWKFTYPLRMKKLQFQEAVGSFVADLADINGVGDVTHKQKTHHTVTFECTVEKGSGRSIDDICYKIEGMRYKYETQHGKTDNAL